DVSDRRAAALQGGFRSHDDAILRGVDFQDVETLRRRDADAAPLADRVPVMAGVLAHAAAGGLDHSRLWGHRETERRRVARDELAGSCPGGNETDLLALFLVRVGQAGGARTRAHFALRQVPDRKPGSGELLL